MIRFEKKGKLFLRYIDPFEVLKRINKVAHWLVLLASMNCIHNVFHISLLYKYVGNPLHVLGRKAVELEDNLIYEE